jgi:RHS repeat-associated protein
VVFFKNQRVEPSSDYTCDPLYRLIAAQGREHLGQNAGGALAAAAQVTDDDSLLGRLPQPGDGNAMGTYIESYAYDALGNIQSMTHQVASGGWTRRYAYNEASRIVAGETGNRLSATSLPSDPTNGPFSATYVHDAHGNMTKMPHLQAMVCSEDDHLQATTRTAGGATPPTTYYTYDSAGQRLRKVVENQTATRASERIYLGGVEVYREFAADGTTTDLSRETFSVTVGEQVGVRVETRTLGTDPGSAQQVRYQFANHLNSAALELDDAADVISYEEYFPFGATSYQAVASLTDVAKRYRYTGKEHDDENGLYYHGARYYAAWLGRWTACDPAGIVDGPNLYAYCRCQPTARVDALGMKSEQAPKYEPDHDTENEHYGMDWMLSEETAKKGGALAGVDRQPEKKSKSVGAAIGGFFLGLLERVGEAITAVFEGVELAVRRFFDPIFHHTPGPGALALGIVGAAVALLAAAWSAVGTLLFLEPVGRSLTPKELAVTRDVFGDKIDLSRVRIKSGFSLSSAISRLVSHAAASEMNYQIFNIDSATSKEIFVHEMGHVWQEQHGNTTVRVNNASYDWEYAVVHDQKPFEKLGVEQQAGIISKAYAYEEKLKEYEIAKKEFETAPPLPPEIVKIYGPRTAPVRPSETAGSLWIGIKVMDDYFLDVLRQVREGKGAAR